MTAVRSCRFCSSSLVYCASSRLGFVMEEGSAAIVKAAQEASVRGWDLAVRLGGGSLDPADREFVVERMLAIADALSVSFSLVAASFESEGHGVVPSAAVSRISAGRLRLAAEMAGCARGVVEPLSARHWAGEERCK